MFEVHLVKGGIILKNLSKMMKELVEVASFHCFSSGGIFFDTMDSDNLIVNFILRSRAQFNRQLYPPI